MLSGLPIRHRLQALIVLTTGLSLAMACAVFIAFEWRSSLQLEKDAALAIGRISADANSANLAFQSTEQAQKSMAAFHAEPDVLSAALYDSRGRLFAQYVQNEGDRPPPEQPGAPGLFVRGKRLVLIHAVTEGPKNFGTLYLCTSLEDMYSRMSRYAGISLLIFFGALLAAFLIGRILQQSISEPILSLTQTARLISVEKNYSVRARLSGMGELELLRRAFNQMLDRIQEQQTALNLELAERKRAQEAEARERQLLATTLASIGDAVIVTNAQGCITFLNGEAERLTRWQNADAIGRPLPDVFKIINEVTRQPVENPVDKVLRIGAVVGLANHTILIGKDGAETPIDDSAAPIRQPGAALSGVVLVFRDFTEQKAAQKALADAQQDLVRHAATLEAAVADRTAKLRETIGELEAFSYSIAHDMRAPLRAMQGFSNMLQEEYSDVLAGEGKEYLRRIAASANRLDYLIQDVLNYSKIVRGEVTLEPMNLEEFIHDIVQSYPNLQAPRATIELASPIPLVLANRAALTQVISNLLGNAVKFVEPGVKPFVQIWCEDGQTAGAAPMVRICIRDNGIGIRKEAHERIFMMFQRLNRPGQYEGTGIGLAIVRKAVERMGGRAGVDSEPGKGSTFWFELMRAE